MVAMPKLTCREALESHVVFAIRRRHDDVPRLRALEHGALEGSEARGIEMLDHLDDRGRIVSLETAVTIGQRSMEQSDSLPLSLRHPIPIQTPPGDLQG